MADASADTGSESGDTAFRPLLVGQGTRFSRRFREDQGTGVTSAFMRDAGRATDIGVLEPGGAQRETLGVYFHFPLDKILFCVILSLQDDIIP